MDARRHITWKTNTRVRWVLLDYLKVIVNYGHSWCLHDSRVSCCQVFPCKVVYDSNIHDTLGMSDGLIAEFKCRTFNFILLF
jgi:hypothetical protein